MSNTPEAILKQYFGYDTFRGGQRQAVDALLQGQDVLCVMPTGAGKSVCYQVPAMALPGLTLVISPLISLMKDQVASLTRAGIPAAYLNSALTDSQFRLALSRMACGAYKIVYVAPERLSLDSFRELCARMDISLIAVDEAHCISQWGQDFRPDYLKIVDFIHALPKRPTVGAFTATATPEVAADITARLELVSPQTVRTGFDRPNLFSPSSSPAARPMSCSPTSARTAARAVSSTVPRARRSSRSTKPSSAPVSPPRATMRAFPRRSASRTRRISPLT